MTRKSNVSSEQNDPLVACAHAHAHSNIATTASKRWITVHWWGANARRCSSRCCGRKSAFIKPPVLTRQIVAKKQQTHTHKETWCYNVIASQETHLVGWFVEAAHPPKSMQNKLSMNCNWWSSKSNDETFFVVVAICTKMERLRSVCVFFFVCQNKNTIAGVEIGGMIVLYRIFVNHDMSLYLLDTSKCEPNKLEPAYTFPQHFVLSYTYFVSNIIMTPAVFYPTLYIITFKFWLTTDKLYELEVRLMETHNNNAHLWHPSESSNHAPNNK